MPWAGFWAFYLPLPCCPRPRGHTNRSILAHCRGTRSGVRRASTNAGDVVGQAEAPASSIRASCGTSGRTAATRPRRSRRCPASTAATPATSPAAACRSATPTVSSTGSSTRAPSLWRREPGGARLAVDLEPPPGFVDARAFSGSLAGQVVGEALNGPTRHAVSWRLGTRRCRHCDLGVPEGFDSSARVRCQRRRRRRRDRLAHGDRRCRPGAGAVRGRRLAAAAPPLRLVRPAAVRPGRTRRPELQAGPVDQRARGRGRQGFPEERERHRPDPAAGLGALRLALPDAVRDPRARGLPGRLGERRQLARRDRRRRATARVGRTPPLAGCALALRALAAGA